MPLEQETSKINDDDSAKLSLTFFKTICNLCSVGCTLELGHENGQIKSIKGSQGLINANAEICDFPKVGYKIIDNKKRITTPLIRKNSHLEPVSWEDAFKVIHERITSGDANEKAFFAGARLTNEEQYLVMKLCRAGAYSNNIGSFHYLGRGKGYTKLSRANIPFAELVEANKLFIIGAEVYRDNPVAGEFIFQKQKELQIPIELVTTNHKSSLIEKANNHTFIKSYFHFIKAVNHYIVSKGKEDQEYIKNLIDNFEDYKKSLLAINFEELCDSAGVTAEIVEKFANDYRSESHAVIIFSEMELSGHACGEIFNLALLTGKHGRSGAGLLLIKENNNSHGLHDIGVMWNLGPGATPWDDPFQRSTIQFNWGSKDLPTGKASFYNKLRDNGYESLFIFGEDPIGCAIDKDSMKMNLSKSRFILVQDYFLTQTAEIADLVLPASFPYETGGTFTNCQRVIQKVDKRMTSPLEYNSWEQLQELVSLCGYDKFETVDDVTFEIASLLPKFCTSSKLLFRMNDDDNYNPMFERGCDSIFYSATGSLV
ncbi:MAG: molybdopterin oxidoreductase family protein [Omnitrophica WOR_2 bacterium]